MREDPNFWRDFNKYNRDLDKQRRYRNLEVAETKDDGKWTKVNRFHWTRKVKGFHIDFWPTKRKFRFKGKNYTGSVDNFIRKVEECG